MKITAEDYAPMKAFFGWMLDNGMPLPAGLRAGRHPMILLEAAEQKSAKAAHASLALAIGDLVDLFADIGKAQTQAFDEGLLRAGLPTLTQVKARHWTKVRSILKRGRLRSESEFHALRNVVEAMPEGEIDKAWAILAHYEKNAAVEASR